MAARGPAGPLLALAAVLVAAAGTLALGPLALLALGGGVLALVLLGHPAWAVTVLLATAVFLSTTAGELPIPTERYWQTIGGVAPFEAMLALATLAVALDVLRRGGDVRGLGPLSWPIGVLAFALLFGGVVGYLYANGLQPVAGTVRSVAPLVVVPLLVVNVLRTRADVERAVLVGLGALVASVLLTVGLYATGRGTVTTGTETATSLAPEPNLLALLLVCAPLAARLGGVGRRPALDLVGALALVSLILSLRRSFYLALGLALLVLLVVGLRGARRAWLAPGLAVAAAVVVVVLSGGLRGLAGTGSVGERLAGLDPGAVAASKQDRYRVNERANVLAEVRRRPLTGAGAGGTWSQRSGVSIDLPANLRSYAHNAALWFWLQLGLLGVLAYVWLMAAIVWVAGRTSRTDPSPRVRAAALVVCAGVGGLVLVELTAAFTGPFQRTNVILGGLVGLLAAVAATRPAILRPRPAADPPVPATPVALPRPRGPRPLESVR